MSETVQSNFTHSIIAQAVASHDRVANLNIADLQRMERQLIPLLNTVRQMQGKRPVIVPGEKRTQG
jgi:hypothetical protein